MVRAKGCCWDLWKVFAKKQTNMQFNYERNSNVKVQKVLKGKDYRANAWHASQAALAIIAYTLMNPTLNSVSVNHHLGSAAYKLSLGLFGVVLQLKPAGKTAGPGPIRSDSACCHLT